MIRNFIMRQMSMNRYGLFQFLKRNVSEHQKQYLELKSQYQNTQNIDQQIEILKGMLNVRHQIDDQDNISLETIDSYYNFINDYQTCLRKGLKINKETADLYKQVYYRFIDQTIFDKITENGLFILSLVDIKFLEFNSLVYLLEDKYESKNFKSIPDIVNKIIEVSSEISLSINTSPNKLKVQILAISKIGFSQYIVGQFKEAEDVFKVGLKEIQSFKQFHDVHSIEMKNSDKEWLINEEVNLFESLANIYMELGKNEKCIEYQDKALQLIKEHEGISYYYVLTLYNFNNQFGELNFYRQLKIIEETCSNLEKNEQYLLMQFQRLKVLYYLEQLNNKEFDRILKLHQEVEIIDDNFHTAFYGAIIICAIRLKSYSDINKWIDLMFSYISEITYNQVDLVVSLRKTLYEEFFRKQLNHKKNLYEKTMIYFQEKTYPFFSEIQKQFAENYFNFSTERQIQIREQIFLILRDYLIRSIYGNDHHLIRVALEKTFKLFLNNPNYKETILIIFSRLDGNKNLPPQIKSQLSKYILQLEQKNNQ